MGGLVEIRKRMLLQSDRNLHARPVVNRLLSRRNNAPSRSHVVGLYNNRRVIGDVAQLNSVLMQFNGSAEWNRQRQFTRVEDVEARSHAALSSRAENIVRKF